MHIAGQALTSVGQSEANILTNERQRLPLSDMFAVVNKVREEGTYVDIVLGHCWRRPLGNERFANVGFSMHAQPTNRSRLVVRQWFAVPSVRDRADVNGRREHGHRAVVVDARQSPQVHRAGAVDDIHLAPTRGGIAARRCVNTLLDTVTRPFQAARPLQDRHRLFSLRLCHRHRLMMCRNTKGQVLEPFHDLTSGTDEGLNK